MLWLSSNALAYLVTLGDRESRCFHYYNLVSQPTAAAGGQTADLKLNLNFGLPGLRVSVLQLGNQILAYLEFRINKV